MGIKIVPDYINYVTENYIVFVSGCNVVLYNLKTKEQQFLIRKNNRRSVTHLSVGTSKSSQNNISKISNSNKDIKEKAEPLICIAEFAEKEDLFYITIIKPFNPNIQYTIKSTEKKWKIKFSTILNDSPYCVTISQKQSTSLKTPILSKITFCKYPFETIVSQEVVPEEIIYCCYNPKNTIELIICGKGYLRMWDVFINEGAIKEHQQRFLRGKQEKEKTFIKAQFFMKKQFLLIAGTKENMFFIFEGYQLIHELNVCYSYENIYDLNAQHFNKIEESDDISVLKENLDLVEKKNIDNKLKEISDLLSINLSNDSEKDKDGKNKDKDKDNDNNSNESNNENDNNKKENESEESESMGKSEEKMSEKEKIIQKLYKPKGDEEEDEKLVKNNGVKYFELINDNLLFVIYIKDGCSLFYKIDWNRKIQDDETEAEFRKWKAAENRIIRIARNIKTFHGFSMNKASNDIILITESYENEKNIKKGKTYLSLFKLKKTLIKEQKSLTNSLHFEYQLFKGFFKNLDIKYIDLWEKKNIILILDTNGDLYSFNIKQNEYMLNYHFEEEIFCISTNPINNYIAIAFKNKVSIFGKLKNVCESLVDFEVSDSLVKWSFNGKYLIISGKNKNIKKKENYCLYVVDYLKYNTIKVIESIPYKITELKFIDDRYLFCLLSDNIISGFFLQIIDNSYSLYELYKKEKDHYILANKQFPRIFYYSNKTHHYSTFDYDSNLKILIAIEYSLNKMHLLIPKKSKNSKIYNENIEIKNCNLFKIQLIKELKILVGGDDMGTLNIYNWPFKNYDYKPNLNENLRTHINLETEGIKTMLNFKNYHSFITLFNNSTIFINELLINKNNSYKPFEYFNKRMKPQMELFFQVYSLYEMKKEDIFKKEQNAEYLEERIEKIKKIMDEDIQEIQDAYNLECKTMEKDILHNADEEEKKFKDIEQDLINLKEKMGQDTQKRLEIMENKKLEKENKYKTTLSLYNKEINRLKEDLLEIRKNMKEAYNNESINQKKYLDDLIKDYTKKFDEIKNETSESLSNLVNISGEYDEATETIVEDYKKLIEKLDKKIKETIDINNSLLKERHEKLLKEKNLEDEHKTKLEEKVKESDKLIEKNVEIKQNIINATQRTITFQEQLLETEKNLLKIDKKLEDLVIKNKHLEQIRFVLEHRMSSLEKEKAPLEGQCTFLENQKNKLTEEFNKIILQINMNNQELENKQSQLRASLIQNYEAIDQKIYVEEKIAQLKKDLDKFIEEHIKLNDNKASRTALDFRDFYIKYFTNDLDDELIEYQYYSQKLQEQKEKEGIANNYDLIMRNKAEEKLITEKKKVEELKLVKENGFRRLQNENTILINECNRLRKNLHEIYLHVIDIEQRFENLTKIDPTLSKSQIVKQIKDFIKKTHEQIKENYSRSNNIKGLNKNLNLPNNKNLLSGRPQNKRYITPLNKSGMNRNRSTNNINPSYFDNKKIAEVFEGEDLKIEINKNNINKDDNEEGKKNFYENLIQKPKKMNRVDSLIMPNHSIAATIKRGKIKLPSIANKK